MDQQLRALAAVTEDLGLIIGIGWLTNTYKTRFKGSSAFFWPLLVPACSDTHITLRHTHIHIKLNDLKRCLRNIK